MPTYWLSLAPESGPARVILLDGEDEILIRVRIHAQKLYRPGDELLIIPVAPNEPEFQLPRDRFLTDEELKSVHAAKLGDVDPDLS